MLPYYLKMVKLISLLVVVLLLTISSRSQVRLPKASTKDQVKASAVVDRAKLLAYAESLLGSPYMYGSCDPKKGFDCSGFVSYVFRNFHIQLPRSSGEYKTIGKDLKPVEFKPGDILVFYGFRNKTRIGHVGIIYEAKGMQSTFIHSSSGIVKGVIISELGSAMYTRRFYRCIDVIDGK